MRAFVVIALLALALPAFTFAQGLAPQTEPALARIIVMGDTGTGDAAQRKVATAIGTVCASRGCDFVIVNGDLVYPTGVGSPTDAQFRSKFEIPYAALPYTFYLTLGNHDNSDPLEAGLGTDAGRGDHMVSYHYRTDTSGKWYLPARYYKASVGSVDLISLDTNTMISNGLTRRGTNPVATLEGEDVGLAKQVAWLDETLAASSASWRIAFGHHPLYSNGQHGNADRYDGAPGNGKWVKEVLEGHVCGKVDLYLSGHDHHLEWLKPQAACGATQLIVSGAGAQSRALASTTNADHYARGNTNGFFWLELRASDMTGAVYDANAALLFEMGVAKPRP